jgi:hypothetical protein
LKTKFTSFLVVIATTQYQEAILTALQSIEALYTAPPSNTMSSDVVIGITLCGIASAVLAGMAIAKVIEGGRLV